MAVTIYEALEIIEKICKKKGTQILPIEESVGRIGAEDIEAQFDLPRFDNSAMDGFAVKISDSAKEVKVIGRILAGEESNLRVEKGIAVKIMTGARIPDGCEAVVPIEDTLDLGESVKLPENIKENANIRPKGEDVAAGETILRKGEKITPYKISVLSSQGVSYVKVYRRPTVAVFATGKELKMHYEKILSHQIYNSNTPTMLTRSYELGCDVYFAGAAQDDIESIKNFIKNMLDADMIITSGGVSVGEADFTKDAFKEIGMELFFDKVEIKPGKPTTLGKINNTIILNLPGNPLAAALNFEIFGKFIINILSGREDIYQNYIECKISEDLKNRPGREVVIPGFYDGRQFTPSKKRGPGMVSPLSNSNGFIILDRNTEFLETGNNVKFIPVNFEFLSKNFKDIYTK
ncbi:gephyrin-like molybdotransferase Glp [Nitrosophilus alvini]|uniref:molybdopterin molybdotransferase MoeA n=1 Tax=Nitrosophilus alvini TaxID=2714855 RepID=UPI00190AF8DA|nr:gephyrin-like molybdotransferase Glp [Nitrosophilus alvini]